MERDVKIWLKQKGKEFLVEIGIRKGQVVLDFGCSEGHYTIPVAKVVGKEGKVYAVDKDEEVLNKLMQIAKKESLKNIVPIKTEGELKITLKNESVDVILLYDVLHYINKNERKKILDEVYRILKKDGLLSVYPKHYKLDEPLWELSNLNLEDIIKEIKKANFYIERKDLKELIHDDNYNKGYILNFRKE